MEHWIPIITAWGAAVVSGGFAVWQWFRSSRREAEKELNLQRLKVYPEVQEFLSGTYGKGWSGAMQEKSRLKEMMELSNKLILWASNDTLVTWIKLVEEGQRGKLTTPRFAQQWTQLDANMRKDLGYGSGLAPEQLYPILFSPETVDRIKTASLDD